MALEHFRTLDSSKIHPTPRPQEVDNLVRAVHGCSGPSCRLQRSKPSTSSSRYIQVSICWKIHPLSSHSLEESWRICLNEFPLLLLLASGQSTVIQNIEERLGHPWAVEDQSRWQQCRKSLRFQQCFEVLNPKMESKNGTRWIQPLRCCALYHPVSDVSHCHNGHNVSILSTKKPTAIPAPRWSLLSWDLVLLYAHSRHLESSQVLLIIWFICVFLVLKQAAYQDRNSHAPCSGTNRNEPCCCLLLLPKASENIENMFKTFQKFYAKDMQWPCHVM